MAKTSLRLLLLITLATGWPIANAGGPCHLKPCGSQSCNKGDTSIYAALTSPCVGNDLCCPLGPQKNIVLCEQKDMGGECISQAIAPEECLTVTKSDRASSAIPLADCYRLYKDDKCNGPSRALYRDVSKRSQNLADIGMDDVVSSVSLCSANIQCPAKRSKRAVNNKYKCRFFDEEITIGFLPWLSRDTSNLNGPVQWYQTGPNGRTEVMHAVVELNHLGSGTPTVRTPGDRISRMGMPGDDAGHILANTLGGSGTDDRNLFPQSSHFNRGAWSSYVENWVTRVVRQFGRAHYTVNLFYDTTADTRPTFLTWRIEWVENGQTRVQVGDLLNPLPGEKGA